MAGTAILRAARTDDAGCMAAIHAPSYSLYTQLPGVLTSQGFRRAHDAIALPTPPVLCCMRKWVSATWEPIQKSASGPASGMMSVGGNAPSVRMRTCLRKLSRSRSGLVERYLNRSGWRAISASSFGIPSISPFVSCPVTTPPRNRGALALPLQRSSQPPSTGTMR
jgi:hypothetical protein